MKSFNQFIKEIRAPGEEECPDGMRFDKKLKICVPVKSKSGYGGRWMGHGYRPHQNGNQLK